MTFCCFFVLFWNLTLENSFYQIPEVVTHKLFINICSWEKVPPPQTDKDPIPVMAGEVNETTDSDVTYSVVDVLFHPSILKGVENKKDHRNLLIHLAIDYLEDTKHIRLLRKYKNLKIKYKGDTKALKRFLSQGREKLPFMQGSSTAAGEIRTDSPQSLLQQLTSLNSTEKKKESSGINLFTPQQHVSNKAKKGLIQEISSSPVHSIPTVPHYEVVMKEPDEKYPKRIIVKVDLPCIESTRECELDVSEVLQYISISVYQYMSIIHYTIKLSTEG